MAPQIWWWLGVGRLPYLAAAVALDVGSSAGNFESGLQLYHPQGWRRGGHAFLLGANFSKCRSRSSILPSCLLPADNATGTAGISWGHTPFHAIWFTPTFGQNQATTTTRRSVWIEGEFHSDFVCASLRRHYDRWQPQAGSISDAGIFECRHFGGNGIGLYLGMAQIWNSGHSPEQNPQNYRTRLIGRAGHHPGRNRAAPSPLLLFLFQPTFWGWTNRGPHCTHRLGRRDGPGGGIPGGKAGKQESGG